MPPAHVLGITVGGVFFFFSSDYLQNPPCTFPLPKLVLFLNLYYVGPLSLLVFPSYLEKKHHSCALNILRMDTLQNLMGLYFLLFSF